MTEERTVTPEEIKELATDLGSWSFWGQRKNWRECKWGIYNYFKGDQE